MTKAKNTPEAIDHAILHGDVEHITTNVGHNRAQRRATGALLPLKSQMKPSVGGQTARRTSVEARRAKRGVR